MAFSKFSSLPLELQQHIMGRCTSGDVLRLAQVSHEACTLALPVLYRHVDISCHNQEGLVPSSRHDKLVESNCPDRYFSGEEYDRLQVRQERFVDAIIQDPTRGALVMCFTWTYEWYSEHNGDERQKMMWKAFKLLTRVQRLDICSFNKGKFAAIPPPLFTSATSLRIGGRMNYAFFRAMVSSPETVTSLELDNPQGFGQIRDADGYDEDYEYEITTLLGGSLEETLGWHEETEDGNHLPVLRHDGPMRGHLRPLFGRFIKLTHLSIRTVGQDDSDVVDSNWSEVREKARYTEIANFIKSVSSTLVNFNFEQGIEAELISSMNCRPRTRGRLIGRPMDTYFISYLLPTLIDGPWPKLKAMSIHGVGGQIRESIRWWISENPAVLENAKQHLRSALDSQVKLNWQNEVGSLFYMEPGSNYRVPGAATVP